MAEIHPAYGSLAISTENSTLQIQSLVAASDSCGHLFRLLTSCFVSENVLVQTPARVHTLYRLPVYSNHVLPS